MRKGQLEAMQRAAERARRLTDAQLATSLVRYAADLQDDGRAYSPQFMREAAYRLGLPRQEQ